MNNFEANVVEREITSLFSARYVEDKIKAALKASSSEFNQKLLLGIQDVAVGVVEDFKANLRKELQQASNDWVSNGAALEVVPTGTRYITSNYSRGGKTVVVEYAPTLRTLQFNVNCYDCGGTGAFRLAFPYVIFIVRLIPYADYQNRLVPEQVYIGYRAKPLTSLSDKIYRPNLPNVNLDGHICLGSAWSAKVLEPMLNKLTPYTLSDIVEAVVGYFWNSEFNNDLPDWMIRHAVGNPKIRTLKLWEQNSAKDPLFMLKLNWGDGSSLSDHCADRVEARINSARIVDRTLNEASRKLTGYLNTVSQVSADPRRAVDTMRNALYESLHQTCARILDGVRNRIAQDAARVAHDATKVDRAKIREEVEAELRREKGQVKPLPSKEAKVKRYLDGDYLYRPPAEEVW